MTFQLDRSVLTDNPRVHLIDDLVPVWEHLDNIERGIKDCYYAYPENEPVQHGRVIMLRSTDAHRLSSAFKAALYLGKYDDMSNEKRFLNNMVKPGHSYEPIRGELITFLFIGVGKPVYDHLITHSVGRTARIAGGQRANLPWGYEVPVEARDKDRFMARDIERIREIVSEVQGLGEEEKEQMQAARSGLPVGYIMPPFMLEFSEEALATSVLKRRIFENGAQGATKEIVWDMWECLKKVDPEKWEILFDYHGPHTQAWQKGMRTLRDKDITLSDLIDMGVKNGVIIVDPDEDGEGYSFDNTKVSVYDLMMGTVAKVPMSMWDKK